MPWPRPTLTALRTSAMQDITASDLPNADGFLRRSPLRIMAWIQAGLAYLHYGFLDWISRMAVPFTALDEYLEGWAAIAPTPVLRMAPTNATGPVTWTGQDGTALPVGTRCARRGDNLQFHTTTGGTVHAGTVTVSVVSANAGSIGNSDAGTTFTLSTVIPNIAPNGTAAAPIAGGVDLETDDALKNRMLESYAAPPHGGNGADYVTWALQVPGVTRAWTPAIPLVPGAATVFFMMDVAQAAHGGFPQGTDGVATLETRDVVATGDQLAVANHLFPLRPVTMLVYAVAPVAVPQDFIFTGLTGTTSTQRDQIVAALTGLLNVKDSPLGTAIIQQSDVDAAVSAIGGLPGFAVRVPSGFPLVSPVGGLFTLGAVTYP